MAVPRLFFAASCMALLYVYHSLLASFGLLTLDFKFWSFVLATPVVKWFCMPSLTMAQFLMSVFVDTTTAIVHFKVLIPIITVTTGYFWSTALLIPLLILVQECIEYLLCRRKGETYVIKSTNNPLDFLLVVVLCASFEFYARYGDVPVEFVMTPNNMLGFWIAMLQFDLVFGTLHHFSHSRPAAWELHKIHHQYKGADLNSLANFYSDFYDSLGMNIPGLTVCGDRRALWTEMVQLVLVYREGVRSPQHSQ